jgi:hypothetical protein
LLDLQYLYCMVICASKMCHVPCIVQYSIALILFCKKYYYLFVSKKKTLAISYSDCYCIAVTDHRTITSSGIFCFNKCQEARCNRDQNIEN